MMNNGEEEQTTEMVYGGWEGSDSMYVKIISSDDFEFFIKRDLAMISGMIKAMLGGPGQFAEHEANEIKFREIPSRVLKKVLKYFTYKSYYNNSSMAVPEFRIKPEFALDMLLASNFLDC